MLITKQIEIDYGHRIPNHKSKCYSPHWHRGKIVDGVSGQIKKDSGNSCVGMVVYCSIIKDALIKWVDKKYDHAFILYENDILTPLLKNKKFKIVIINCIPTAENLANMIFIDIYTYFKLLKSNIELEYIEFWETPNSMAKITKNEMRGYLHA